MQEMAGRGNLFTTGWLNAHNDLTVDVHNETDL